MENLINPSLEGVISLNPEIKAPEKRIIFWKQAMEEISQRVGNKEISEEQANEERACIIAQKEAQATTDTLTGLRNRRGFEDIFNKDLATAKRNLSPLSLLFIDADDLKAVNKLGHDKGDEFLKTIALAIRESIRENDTGSRWAGDEFTVLCPGSDLEGGLQIANRILNSVRNHEIEGKKLTVSIGVGQITALQDIEVDDQIKTIDQALNEAKKLGKNQIVTVKLNG